MVRKIQENLKENKIATLWDKRPEAIIVGSVLASGIIGGMTRFAYDLTQGASIEVALEDSANIAVMSSVFIIAGPIVSGFVGLVGGAMGMALGSVAFLFQQDKRAEDTRMKFGVTAGIMTGLLTAGMIYNDMSKLEHYSAEKNIKSIEKRHELEKKKDAKSARLLKL